MCPLDAERRPVIPPSLFSAATSIRISGSMPSLLFSAMTTNPHIVRSLYIDRVLCVRPLPPPPDHPVMSDLTIWPYPPYRSSSWGPHPMSDHFAPFISKFSLLQHLHVRTIGERSCCPTNLYIRGDRLEDRYIELASFIDSLKPQPQDLILEFCTRFCTRHEEAQGGCHTHTTGLQCPPQLSNRKLRHTDIFFRSIHTPCA